MFHYYGAQMTLLAIKVLILTKKPHPKPKNQTCSNLLYRCRETGVHADESLFPAVDTNEALPLLMKKVSMWFFLFFF